MNLQFNSNDEITNLFKNSCESLIHLGYDLYDKYKSNINNVCNLFSDDYSKELYKKEIVFALLNKFIPDSLSPQYAGLMDSKKFNKSVSLVYLNPIFKDGQILRFFNELDKLYPGKHSIGKFFAYTNFVLEQYRYENLVRVEEGDVCIDAGSCFGDTALYFVKNGAKKVYSFEIDKRNLVFSKRIFPELDIDNVELIEKAVSDVDSELWYKPSGNIGSGGIVRKNTIGAYRVEVCKLDSFCKEKGIIPDLIKMDIEGAEYSALIGAKEIICKYKPKLTICIYHSFEDRFRLPELIKSFVPEYRFYLKKSSPIYETILFCKV